MTRAVQVTLIAEERANGLLCSTHQARRPQVSAHHDAERFSDRDVALIDYHPAFHVAAEQDDLGTPAETGVEPTGAWQAAEQAVVCQACWLGPSIPHVRGSTTSARG